MSLNLTFNSYVDYYTYTGQDFMRAWDRFKTPQNDNFNFSRKALFTRLCYLIGDMELCEHDPIILNTLLSSYSTCMLPCWQRALDALAEEYEPLWNYNKTDEETQDRDRKSNDITESHSDATSKIAGFDSGELVDESQATSGINSEGNLTENENNTRFLHSYGNIGTTTTQQLLNEELEVAKISIYDIIIQDVKLEFAVLIY